MGKYIDLSETLTAMNTAANVKYRIIVCDPSNNGVDNIFLKIIEDHVDDGNDGNYNLSIVRVGSDENLPL